MAELKDWLARIDYKLISGTDKAEVKEVIFDSRKAKEDSVFVCIGGSRIDSHDFIGEVSEKGCRTFVVEKELSELRLPDKELNIVKVDNSRVALAYLSQARFGYPAEKLKLIGITGTKGKTTTANIIASVLRKSGRSVGVIGTNGCFINDRHIETKNTTPESYELHQRFSEMLEAGCEYAVMECSSQGFKMHRTDGIAFDYGIFLNLSPDHIGPLEHKDFDEYMNCKEMLLEQSKNIVINIDDEHAAEVLSIFASKNGIRHESGMTAAGQLENIKNSLSKNVLGVSIREKCSYYGSNLRYRADNAFVGSVFDLNTEAGDMTELSLSLPGDFNVLNAICAAAVLLDTGLSKADIAEGFKDIHVKGRTETVYRSDRFQVLIDYAHNEVSMESLLNTLRQYEPGRLVVVFGCGGNRSLDRRTGMGSAAAGAADLTILTADNSRFEKTEDIIKNIHDAYEAAGGDMDKLIEIPDRREAIYYAMANAQDGDMIAVIGKGHEEYQEENGIRTHFSDSEEIISAAGRLGLIKED